MEVLNTIRVLIAGADEDACWLLRLILQQENNVAVVGYARSGRELTILTLNLSPHVVLLEMDAPGQGMATAVKMTKLQGSEIGFLGLIGGKDVDQMLISEVDALLDKSSPIEQLSSALQSIAGNKAARPLPSHGDSSVTAIVSDQVLALDLADLERRYWEMEEKLNLMQFWLQHLDASALSEAERTPANDSSSAYGVSTVPSYVLSVDSFFNAQHSVTVGGSEGELHTHSWRVNVKLRQASLGEDHLLLGFSDAKRILRGEISWFDGKVLNELPHFNGIPPTTENIAATLFKNLKMAVSSTTATVDSVTVWETPVNSVSYSEDRP